MSDESADQLPKNAAYRSSVANRVARLNVMLKRRLGAFAKSKFDLTIVETRLVILLGMFAPSSVNDLAARSDIDRTQISRSAGVLVERGLASRAPGPIDRREVVVTLTEKGSEVHTRILAELYRHNQDLTRGLTEETMKTFFEVMELLIARAGAQL